MINDLNRLYDKYNREEFIHPDPFEFIGQYDGKEDKEVVGLIAASFAIGNVFQILKFVESVLKVMGPSPSNFLKNESVTNIEDKFNGFYYRYFKDHHIIEFFLNIKRVLLTYGSIEGWVLNYVDEDSDTYFPLFKRLSADFNLSSALIPKSSGNSAFKRLALYFRWMVRKDSIDLGLWSSLSPKKLVVPMDIHMTNISKILGFTTSSTNSMANAIKVTRAFRALDTNDPVKWDFALSRLGIHPDLNYKELIELF